MEVVFLIILIVVVVLAFTSRGSAEHDDFDKWENEVLSKDRDSKED